MSQLGGVEFRPEECVDPAEERQERVVDQPEFAVEHPLPEDREADHRHERRQKENRPEKAARGDVEIEEDGQGERHHQSERNGKSGEEKRVVERFPEDGVGEQIDVVLRADENGGREHGIIAEREIEAAQERINAQGQEPEDPRD